MNPTSNLKTPKYLLNLARFIVLHVFLIISSAVYTQARPQPTPQSDAAEPQVGFIRIIHAVAAGTGKAAFLLDGTDLFPKGYELGQATGGIGIAAGIHKVEITRTGVERGNTEVVVKPGETTTLIGFSEPIPQTDPNAPPAWKIRILRLRQSSPQAGYQLSLVSVCPEPETVVQSSIADSRAIMEITERILLPADGEPTKDAWTPQSTAATLREARATAGEVRGTLEAVEKSLASANSLLLDKLLRTTSLEAQKTIDYAWTKILLAIGLLFIAQLVLLLVAARLFRPSVKSSAP